MIVRPTEAGDRDEVLDVVRAAFSGEGGDGQDEVDIVLATWEGADAVDPIDLVATDDDGRIAGYVLAAAGRLASSDRALAAAPLAVRPDRQRQGVGSALMHDLLDRADRAGWPLVLLLGDPAYYGRFGFEAAAPLGIVYRAVGPESPYFQVRRLSRYRRDHAGDFVYCWEDDPEPTP